MLLLQELLQCLGPLEQRRRAVGRLEDDGVGELARDIGRFGQPEIFGRRHLREDGDTANQPDQRRGANHAEDDLAPNAHGNAAPAMVIFWLRVDARLSSIAFYYQMLINVLTAARPGGCPGTHRAAPGSRENGHPGRFEWIAAFSAHTCTSPNDSSPSSARIRKAAASIAR
ncbi:MAG: hypothetical protein E5V89_28630 [Mesorhizobium sp.]|nr:MAG: hypothetical protein E5V89_28630 [Mesorhizobium sp.]